MKKICGIYKITSPSKKIYIGQSRNILRRFIRYKNLDCKSQICLYRSLLKYSPAKHKFEIIHECPREQLNELEIYYIELYQCFNSKYGMNLQSGGKIYEVSEETRKKMSERMKGNTYRLGTKLSKEEIIKRTNSRKGYRHSDETRTKISIAQTNRIQKPRRPCSEETKIKLHNIHKGRVLTTEWKEKLSKSHKGKQPWLGKKHTEESKEKMRISAINRINKLKLKKDEINIVH